MLQLSLSHIGNILRWYDTIYIGCCFRIVLQVLKIKLQNQTKKNLNTILNS